MKVLVPLDGSVLAECLLAPALRLAGGGELDLVRVLAGPRAEWDQRAQTAAEEYLEAQRRRLEAEGVTVRWDLEAGDPAEKILVVVRERRPDFIAMATHGETGAVRRGRGSVAERVLRECSVPILMANPRSIPGTHGTLFHRLLVCLDGSELADAVLPRVEGLARIFGSEVVLLRVQPTRRLAQAAFDPAELSASLAPQRERLEEQGIRTRAWAAQGDPAEEILRAAEEADLVCMSTHGRSGLSRWWFGSVAEQVLRVCSRPLLVVRPARDD